MKKAILLIAISILLVGCQETGRGDLATPAVSPLPAHLAETATPTPKPPRLTPTPSPIPVPPSPTPPSNLTEEDIEALRRCLNNGIYRHINHREKGRLKFEKYRKQEIVVRVYDYFDPLRSGKLIFSLSSDYYEFGINKNYLNGPVHWGFGILDKEGLIWRNQQECDGQFTFDFDPKLEYDFENKYFDRWPQIRKKIIEGETERWSELSGAEYWLRFFEYSEERANIEGEAEVYFIFESTKSSFVDVLKADVYEDGAVSYGWAVDTTDAGLKYYRKQVFDEVKIKIP